MNKDVKMDVNKDVNFDVNMDVDVEKELINGNNREEIKSGNGEIFILKKKKKKTAY